MNFNDWFYYDETSPSCLRWKVDKLTKSGRKTKISAGDVAGCPNSNDYFQVWCDGSIYRVHRIIWEIHYGKIQSDLVVDHFDRNPLNNSLKNLRVIPKKENAKNRRAGCNNKSGVTGVSIHKTKTCRLYWMAHWRDLSGRRKARYFSIDKYGYDHAFIKACECRNTMIQVLNEKGAGYTEHHGLIIS